MRQVIVVFGMIVSVSVPLLAATKIDSQPQEVRRTLDGILQEAQRQERVSGETASTIHEFKKLVEDLKANGLLPEAKGDELVAMAEALAATDHDHIRVAASKLRNACKDDTGRATHLATAQSEVEKAMESLQDLLRKANALIEKEVIKTEITKIVTNQAVLIATGTRIGLAIHNGEEVKPHDIDTFMEQQEGIVKRLSALEDQFDSAGADDENGNLAKAKDILHRQSPKPHLIRAIHSADNNDFMDTVAEQKVALGILKDIEAKVHSDKASPREQAPSPGNESATATAGDSKNAPTTKPGDKPGQISTAKPGPFAGLGQTNSQRPVALSRLPEVSTSLVGSLDRHERDALSQNFASELPREYRDMLRAYYQRLSKN